MERQRQSPLPLILFHITVSGSTKHTYAFACVSFIEPVQCQAEGCFRLSDGNLKLSIGCPMVVVCETRIQGRTSESLRQSPQTLVSSGFTAAGTNRHINAIALLSLFVPVTGMVVVKLPVQADRTIRDSLPQNCQDMTGPDNGPCRKFAAGIF